MTINVKDLLASRLEKLTKSRHQLKHQPGLALVWVGDDPQTALFIRSKQRLAQSLDCQFFLHQFSSVTARQLEAVLNSLARRADVHGIVLQLPLPKNLPAEKFIELIPSDKDVDGLTKNSPFPAPTAQGIVEILQSQGLNLGQEKTVILGTGRLVGAPLAAIFAKNNWPHLVINKNAEQQVATIKKHSVLIACTGVPNLVSPAMANPQMVVIDGSGVDVDVEKIEPLVKAITPSKGAVGPMTVSWLFENLLRAANR